MNSGKIIFLWIIKVLLFSNDITGVMWSYLPTVFVLQWHQSRLLQNSLTFLLQVISEWMLLACLKLFKWQRREFPPVNQTGIRHSQFWFPSLSGNVIKITQVSHAVHCHIHIELQKAKILKDTVLWESYNQCQWFDLKRLRSCVKQNLEYSTWFLMFSQIMIEQRAVSIKDMPYQAECQIWHTMLDWKFWWQYYSQSKIFYSNECCATKCHLLKLQS